ncbi:MAG: hypothetical protein HG458_003720 [Prevotella sp.]|nr:hypothetical protein [Prevotella sp.]
MNNLNKSVQSAWTHFKEEVLQSKNMIISLNADDLNVLEEKKDAGIFVFEVSTDDTSESRFKLLCNKFLEQYSQLISAETSILKMLMLVQTPVSIPATMNDMSHFNNLVHVISPSNRDLELKWGIALREDRLSKLSVAVQYKL